MGDNLFKAGPTGHPCTTVFVDPCGGRSWGHSAAACVLHGRHWYIGFSACASAQGVRVYGSFSHGTIGSRFALQGEHEENS